MTKWPTFWDFILKSEKCLLFLIHVLGLDLHVLGLSLGCLWVFGLGLEKILKSLALASTLRSLALLQHCNLRFVKTIAKLLIFLKYRVLEPRTAQNPTPRRSKAKDNMVEAKDFANLSSRTFLRPRTSSRTTSLVRSLWWHYHFSSLKIIER